MSQVKRAIAEFVEVISQKFGRRPENNDNQAVFRQLPQFGKNAVIFAKSMLFGAIDITDGFGIVINVVREFFVVGAFNNGNLSGVGI